tara:strand:- start:1683 stop:2030 length:348 start_codon:yes stop_codon:yes gene_type:complete
MDERYESLCEIGQVLIDSEKKDLLKVYTDMLLEHYPAELICESFQSSDSEDEDYVAPIKLELVKEKVIKKKKKTEIVVDGESDSDSEDDDSEEEGALVKEELSVTVDEKGFHALA